MQAPSRGAVAAGLGLAIGATACWRTGEGTPGNALVTWAAYPESVRVGETFSFEFAGPVSPNGCGRLDTAYLAVGDSAITLSARRSTFRAVCAPQRISFYEAHPLAIDRPGEYRVVTDDGRELGTLVATDSGPFSRMRAIGLGTVREVSGCRLFGPGWVGNQRVFALLRAPAEVEAQVDEDRVVFVRGTLVGFTSCGSFGSRPSIRVDTAWVTGLEGDDYYRDASDGAATTFPGTQER